ncbi:MAG: ABC transporter permease [Chloroflexi bacterium]|nr:ABC transporter permease [Chloroflexota bacterium]
MRVLPGDIVLVIAGDVPVTAEAREALREELGLNDPLHVQYGRWLWSMVNGQFGGRSLESREPIRSIIARQLPVTLLLASYTVLLSILVSVPLAVLAAVRRNRWPDYVVRVATLGGLALPNLWVALLVILGLLFFFRWSPPIIYTTPWADPWNHMQMMVWPVLVLAWEYSSHLVRVTRSSMLEALGQAYITTARSKGLPERTVIWRHALRNALIPAVTMLGLQFGALLSGALILETIFGLPGMGRGLVQAALARDYPVIQSLASLLVFLALVVNLAVDMLYTFIDPRTSHST